MDTDWGGGLLTYGWAAALAELRIIRARRRRRLVRFAVGAALAVGLVSGAVVQALGLPPLP